MSIHDDERAADRHRSGFRLRLPEIFRAKLQLLKKKTRKPMTVLVQSALKLLLRSFGLWKKKDEEELQREASPTVGHDPT